MLELEIKKKEGNLIDVSHVIETRTKEITLLKKLLSDLIKQAPKTLENKSQDEISNALTQHINSILATISEFITDDWTECTDDDTENDITPEV